MKNILKIFGIGLLVVSLSGCTVSDFLGTSPKAPTEESAVYVSSTNGDSWQKSFSIYSVKGGRSFVDAVINWAVVDPQDSKAIYLATDQYGLLYSFDGGVGWHQTLNDIGKVTSVVVDPKNTCTVYATILNRVYKTTDCARHWTYQLIEAKTRAGDQITTIQLDPIDTQKIYAGSTGGSMFVSMDAGVSWTVINYFKSQIAKIVINPNDHNAIYVATLKDGLFKSIDAGETWIELLTNDIVNSFPQVKEYRHLDINPTVANGLIYAAKNVFFISEDGGETWRNVTLLTPPKSTNISTVAINPLDKNNLFVTVSGILYISNDGGETWKTKKILSSRAPKYLLLTGERANVLILGVYGALKK